MGSIGIIGACAGEDRERWGPMSFFGDAAYNGCRRTRTAGLTRQKYVIAARWMERVAGDYSRLDVFEDEASLGGENGGLSGALDPRGGAAMAARRWNTAPA
ncbi:hypothetical protein KM043_003150 [Ampulex compressa]|nr:hypothetical protein KM043_003150 [Ampulex compressa]